MQVRLVQRRICPDCFLLRYFLLPVHPAHHLLWCQGQQAPGNWDRRVPVELRGARVFGTQLLSWRFPWQRHGGNWRLHELERHQQLRKVWKPKKFQASLNLYLFVKIFKFFKLEDVYPMRFILLFIFIFPSVFCEASETSLGFTYSS